MPTTGEGLVKTLDSRRGSGSGRPGSSAGPAEAGEADGTAPEPSAPARLSSDTVQMLGKLSYVEAIL